MRRGLALGKIVAYAQGFSLYRSASETYHWNLDYGRIASIFRAGCIIQAEFLNKITEAYEKSPNGNTVFVLHQVKINANEESLRQVSAWPYRRHLIRLLPTPWNICRRLPAVPRPGQPDTGSA